MVVEWFKVKNGKMEKISKPSSRISKTYLDLGYALSRVSVKGNKTKIKTFSPHTYGEYKKLSRYG